MTTQTATPTPTNGAHPKVSNVKASFMATLAPSSKAVSRKAWGIDVSTVWLGYFTAAKVEGVIDDNDLPDEELGAPFRLRRDKDTNEVRFSSSGRPMFFVAPHLNDLVNRARDNYVASLLEKTAIVRNERPEAYAKQVDRQHKAGAPIVVKEQTDLDMATMAQHEAALAALAIEAAKTPTPAKRTRKASAASTETPAPTPVEPMPLAA
jgi:hypothetical protein